MSGLVFNAGVILAASMPVGQFLSISFADYGVLTQNNSIFGVQMQSLQGWNYAYASFILLMLVCCLGTFFYYIWRPHKKQKENKLNFEYIK